MWIVLADDSHEKSRLVFSEKKKINKKQTKKIQNCRLLQLIGVLRVKSTRLEVHCMFVFILFLSASSAVFDYLIYSHFYGIFNHSLSAMWSVYNLEYKQSKF